VSFEFAFVAGKSIIKEKNSMWSIFMTNQERVWKFLEIIRIYVN
jgi:hypothetical protein